MEIRRRKERWRKRFIHRRLQLLLDYICWRKEITVEGEMEKEIAAVGTNGGERERDGESDSSEYSRRERGVKPFEFFFFFDLLRSISYFFSSFFTMSPKINFLKYSLSWHRWYKGVHNIGCVYESFSLYK